MIDGLITVSLSGKIFTINPLDFDTDRNYAWYHRNGKIIFTITG